MINRGPDDASTLVLPYVGLGHRRLSIIDLSPRGRQPMSNEDGTVWVVFNGEIYDFSVLRQRLEKAGHRFASDTDSEVLVHGYEEWGIDQLARTVSGMFAFAIWDVRRRELHLVRDRLGKKPLYYWKGAAQFAFASELKALATLDTRGWKMNSQSLARFLYWGYIPGRETIYEDVHQLLPGRLLTVTAAGSHERRYWRLSFANKVADPVDDIVEQTDAILTAAVRRRLRSDVPLGAFLSGGVDSSYVVSRMVTNVDRAVRTFSMGTSDEAHDERVYARRVAAHCRTAHTEFEVTPDAWSVLPRLVWEFGQPFADPACIPTYYVAARARQHVTVALTGDGGDESFAGYSQHQARYLAGLSRQIFPSAVELIGRRGDGWTDGSEATLLATSRRFVRYLHRDPLINWSSVDYWHPSLQARLWRQPYGELCTADTLLPYALEADAEFDGTSPLDRALFHDLNVLLPFCYNVKVDVATMMSSLEARSPFLDHEVVEWAARIPAAVKMRPWNSKALLKRVASRWLPEAVINRPKHGFSVPVDGWFRGPWAPAAHDIIFSEQARDRGYFDHGYLERLWSAHATGQASHGVRFWSLLWLEVWHRMFIDRTMSLASGAPADIVSDTIALRA